MRPSEPGLQEGSLSASLAKVHPIRLYRLSVAFLVLNVFTHARRNLIADAPEYHRAHLGRSRSRCRVVKAPMEDRSG